MLHSGAGSCTSISRSSFGPIVGEMLRACAEGSIAGLVGPVTNSFICLTRPGTALRELSAVGSAGVLKDNYN